MGKDLIGKVTEGKNLKFKLKAVLKFPAETTRNVT